METRICMICGSDERLLHREDIVLCRRCACALHSALQEKLQQMHRGKGKKSVPLQHTHRTI